MIRWSSRATALIAVALAAPLPAAAQEHPPARGDSALAPPDSMAHAMPPGPLGIPATRRGSGTSWLPDLSPMYAVHAAAGAWSLMVHGNIFLQYIDEGGERGDAQLGSINWLMGEARRPLAGGELMLRAMLSAEPLTVGECGYPDLLATGESCDGEPLHDKQHPHDLWMELAAAYSRALGDGVAFQLYGGPAAEPALGPVAYPHRPSALPNPFAPIGHHWLDASHIAFGVVTAGLFTRRWKLEGSVFNGREPDEDRWDLDLAPLDSYAGRLAFADDRWAVQLSAGHLVEAERHQPGEPREDVNRYTASVLHHRPLGPSAYWAAAGAWGRNVEAGAATNALLLESVVNLRERNLFFGRAEWVEKTGADLALEDHDVGGDPDDESDIEHREFPVAKLTLGYVRQFEPIAGWTPGIGASVSVAVLPDDLEPFYGTTTPVGWAVFLSLRPAAIRMAMEVHAPGHH